MVTVVYNTSRHKNGSVRYLAQDWPESLKLSAEAFDAYAKSLEKEDFEDDIRGLSASTHQLIAARRESILKLRASADYLDSVWVRCRVTRSVGTSASVVGGGLTVAGGLLTLATVGAAAPIVVAGIATSSVGAATNIGSSLVERIINSKQVREMNAALTRDKELTLKIEAQLEALMARYSDSPQQATLVEFVADLLGRDHLVLALVRGIFEENNKESHEAADNAEDKENHEDNEKNEGIEGLLAIESKGEEEKLEKNKEVGPTSTFTERLLHTTPMIELNNENAELSTDLTDSTLNEEAGKSRLTAEEAKTVLETNQEAETSNSSPKEHEECNKTQSTDSIHKCCSELPLNSSSNLDSLKPTSLLDASSLKKSRSSPSLALIRRRGSKERLQYTSLSPEMLLETGKVVGQNGSRLIGQVIVGISAAFLLWDALDLGITVNDLIRKKGSNAGKVLRDKAEELDKELRETIDRFSVNLPKD